MALFEEKPLLGLLAPLMLGVPVVTMLNYWMEDLFAQRWGGRWERMRGLDAGTSAPGMRAASGEAAA